MNKCYSRNGEEFNYTELADLFEEMAGDGDLQEGAEYWEAEAHAAEPAHFFDAEDIIENAAERAYEEGGDYAEGFGDVSKEAIAELQELLSAWANKHCSVNFYTVHNAKKLTVTAEQAAEYVEPEEQTK